MSNDELTRAISESRQLEPTTPPMAQAATDATIDLGASVTTDSPLAGRVGSFNILRLLGRGGMGAVYLAEQNQPRRQVALKVMRDERLSDDLLRRFLHESALLARLQHPGIAQIFEAGTAESSGRKLPYFALEFVEGRTLTEYVEEQALSTAGRLKVLVKICEAVEHAHQKGIIHRDLKPGNILVDSSGQPKILDFGIARATDAHVQAATLATSVGQVIGTVPYMSPEQAQADPELLDTRSDVYALGVIGYQLLAGRLPHNLQGRSLPEALRIIIEDEPTPLASVHKSFRGDLATIVGKALEKDKARRYQSAADFARDIERYLRDEPILARPASTWYQVSKFARRNRVLVGGVAAVFFALICGVVGTTTAMVYARSQASLARSESAKARQAESDKAKEAANAAREAANALAHSAELSTRHGKWKEALEQFDKALALGHPDEIGLRIGRLKCYGALNDRRAEAAEIAALSQRDDLGNHAGTVLLQKSLLADLAGSGVGDAAELRRQALTLGLPPGERAFAESFDAQTIPAAIAKLQEAVAHDPYHSLSHERLFVLYALSGKTKEVESTLTALTLLQPDSMNLLAYQGLVFAMSGDAPRAEAVMAELEKRGAKQEASSLRLVFALVGKVRDMFYANDNPEGVSMLPLVKEVWNLSTVAVNQAGARATSAEALTGTQMLNYPLMGKLVRHLAAYIAKDSIFLRSAAADEMGEMAKIWPDGVMLLGHGMALSNAGRHAEAEQVLLAATRAEGLFPVRRRALFALAGQLVDRAEAKEQPFEELTARAAVHARELAKFAPLSSQEFFVACRAAVQANDLPLAHLLLDDWAKVEPNNMVMLVFRCICEFDSGMYENCLATSGRILLGNGDDELGTIAGYRAKALAAMQGEIYPEFDWLRALAPEIEKFAATAKLPGDAADLNAATWPTETVPGSADRTEGVWQSRLSKGSAPGMGFTFSAVIKSQRDRYFIELTHPGQTVVSRRIVARQVGNRLVGWHTNAAVSRDAFPWVGLLVDGERIDGTFPGGRLDLRRKLAPPSSEEPTKP